MNNWPDENRIDVIGQNGNTGEHYDREQLHCMVLAFKACYASHNPQHGEPSDEYIAKILNVEYLEKHSKSLLSSAKMRQKLQDEIKAMANKE